MKEKKKMTGLQIVAGISLIISLVNLLMGRKTKEKTQLISHMLEILLSVSFFLIKSPGLPFFTDLGVKVLIMMGVVFLEFLILSGVFLKKSEQKTNSQNIWSTLIDPEMLLYQPVIFYFIILALF